MSSDGRPILVMVGTRPEAVKLAPVVFALRTVPGLRPVLASSGQHRELLADGLGAFDLVPEHDLQVMTAGQGSAEVASKVLDRLPPLLADVRPAAVLVQGDTTTAAAAGLASFYCGVPVGHVEAGLRTNDVTSPFPEEGNRQVLARLARWQFAPTPAARDNLLAERVPADRVSVVGNTGVDALLWVLQSPARVTSEAKEPFREHGPGVLLTLHRRESFGEPLRAVLGGVTDFLHAHPDAVAVWPVHPNPAVRAAAAEFDHPRLRRVPPQQYRAFATLLAGCKVAVTDSGGVQEEAPSLGKRVLVARDSTERPEAVEAGLNRLVGRDRRRVAAELARAWAEPAYTGPLPAPNPYGDGRAADRIAATLAEQLGAGRG